MSLRRHPPHVPRRAPAAGGRRPCARRRRIRRATAPRGSGRAARWAAALLLVAAPARALGGDDVASLVKELLDGPGPRADRAAERLRYLGPERAGGPVRALLGHSEAKVRVVAASTLELLRDRGSEGALRAALDDEDWEVRRNSARALGALRSNGSAAALARRLESDPSARVRKACALALGALGARPEALARCANRDAELEVRLAALDALAKPAGAGETGSAAVGAALEPLLSDRSELLRFAAARTLAWRGRPSARKFLARQVDAGDYETRQRAILVLGDVPSPWAADLLAQALKAPDFQTRAEAAAALARRSDRRGVEHLREAAARDGEEGARARQALQEAGAAEAAGAGR